MQWHFEHRTTKPVQRIRCIAGKSDRVGSFAKPSISNSALSDTDGLNRYRLFEEPHVLMFPKFAQADTPKKPPQHRQELLSIALPMIFYSRRSALGKAIESQLKRLRLDIPVWIEADTNRIIFSLVANGT